MTPVLSRSAMRKSDEKSLFARNCKRFREESGLTQSELAAQLDVSEAAVKSWESEAGIFRFPRSRTVLTLTQFYQRDIDDFFAEEPGPARGPARVRAFVLGFKDARLRRFPDLQEKAKRLVEELNLEFTHRVSGKAEPAPTVDEQIGELISPNDRPSTYAPPKSVEKETRKPK